MLSWILGSRTFQWRISHGKLCNLFISWEEVKYIPTCGVKRAKHTLGVWLKGVGRVHLPCGIFLAGKKKKGKSILLCSNLIHVPTDLLPLKNMTDASGLAVLFTAEVALQKGEDCSFDLARWLETVHNCTIGLTGVYSCGKWTGAKAWKFPCVNVGLFPTPRGIFFF